MNDNKKMQMVLLLLRCSLFGFDSLNQDELKQIHEFSDWGQVFSELRSQGVDGLVYPIIQELNISDPQTYMALKKSAIQVISRWHQIAYAQNDLVKLLNDNMIPFVIIKGTAAGMYYPQPIYRAPGDIDFLVKQSDFQRTSELLNHNGYILKSDTSQTEHHNTYHKNGMLFELHHRIGGINPSDKSLLSLFEAGIDQRINRQADKYTFPAFQDQINGLVILHHIKQHLREGIGLRHIVDWMMFVDKYITDEIWEKDYSKTLKRLGIEQFAVTVTAVCVKYLGLKKDIHWYQSADTEICDELMEYIRTKGNFGCKRDDEDKIASFWITVHDPISFFKRLQKFGMYRWRAAQKNKLLKPFAWAYQLIYILKTLKTQKRSFSEMKELHRDGQKQGDLIKKLGLFK